jgi:transposase InsO family protein
LRQLTEAFDIIRASEEIALCLVAKLTDDGHTARQPTRGALIHHSDRGVQYACVEYTEILAAFNIQPSMSRIGNPHDNAKAERLHENPEA